MMKTIGARLLGCFSLIDVDDMKRHLLRSKMTDRECVKGESVRSVAEMTKKRGTNWTFGLIFMRYLNQEWLEVLGELTNILSHWRIGMA